MIRGITVQAIAGRRGRGAWRRVGVGLFGFALLACAGCTTELYIHSPVVHNGARVTAPSQWKISGDLPDLALAVDGDIQTGAVSGSEYTNSAVTVDLGKLCYLNTALIEHGRNQHGFCRRVAVLTSANGANFTLQATQSGTRRVTIVSLITPVVARYVQIRAVEPGEQPWSVAEIYFR